jgi:hypothetical protein
MVPAYTPKSLKYHFLRGVLGAEVVALIVGGTAAAFGVLGFFILLLAVTVVTAMVTLSIICEAFED